MMSTAIAPSQSVTSAMPRPKLWTRKEYEHLIDLGAFDPEQRLELIEGEIIEKMPQNEPHELGIMLCTEALRRIFQDGYVVRAQLPLSVGTKSVPEPDFAVVEGTVRDFAKMRPSSALLIIEVSDSTLLYDRTTKARIYARAFVPQYWILNLNERVLEVSITPVRGAYTERKTYAETESVLLNGQSIAIKDLLP